MGVPIYPSDHPDMVAHWLGISATAGEAVQNILAALPDEVIVNLAVHAALGHAAPRDFMGAFRVDLLDTIMGFIEKRCERDPKFHDEIQNVVMQRIYEEEASRKAWMQAQEEQAEFEAMASEYTGHAVS